MTSVGRGTVSAMSGYAESEPCEVVSGSTRVPCDVCGRPIEPEHAHYRCPACGYILPCCGW